MIKSLTTLAQTLNQTAGGLTDGKLADLVDTVFSRSGLVNRTLVDLTAAAQTTLFTVPAGYDFFLSNIYLEGQTAISGGTGSILKVGTVGSLNMLNETTGHTFTSATATTLLPANARRSMVGLYPLSNMNGSTVTKISGGATGTAIVADVSASTAVVTAGKVYTELHGYLRPSA